MAITDWPEAERPREKLLAQGPAQLSDAELLAIFLRTGVTGMSAVELAEKVLHDRGSLRALFEAELDQFSETKGMGTAKYVQLQAVLELSKRYLAEQLNRQAITQPMDAADYIQHQLTRYPFEVFAALFLDSQNRVISFDELFRGTINAAAVYPREVARLAIEKNAAAVIFAHNHPSGIAEPSQSDQHITVKLRDALALLDIKVLDHLVVGAGEVTSMAQRGLI